MASPNHAARGRSLLLPLLSSATLGLAPFFPEPHVVGKLRWVWGGAKGMRALDVFDLVMHAAPWCWLAWALAGWALACSKGQTQGQAKPLRRGAVAAVITSLLLGALCVGWSWFA